MSSKCSEKQYEQIFASKMGLRILQPDVRKNFDDMNAVIKQNLQNMNMTASVERMKGLKKKFLITTWLKLLKVSL